MLRENDLYIDLNESVLFHDKENPLTFQESINLLEQALRYNFHFLNEIYITVNGQVPK